MTEMEIFYLSIALAGTFAALYALWRLRRQQRRMETLTEQIESFLLYPKPLLENLDEGAPANLENQVARLEEELLHQQRLDLRREAQMTAFVENMAHQMKNALTALQIQLDLLQLHIAPEQRETLQKSQNCMERLTGEIDRILKSSQLAAGKIRMSFEPRDLRQLISLSVEQLQPIIDSRGVSVEIAGEKMPMLSADAFWLLQALENVIKNAVEHTASGTTVKISLTDEGRNVRILVEDEGTGIPKEELPELFERFHRGSTAKAGYGIGLSMARDIIAAHHGTLSAGNRETCGAWFELRLPVLEGVRPYAS